MKKVLAVLGCLAVAIGGCVALVVFGVIAGKQAAEGSQRDFYAMVQKGDTTSFLARCDASLVAELDEPVLAAWMATMNEKLGAFKGLDLNGFNFNVKNENGVAREEARGTLQFEKGSAQSEIVKLNGKIAGFHVKAKGIDEAWLASLPATKLYEERGAEFVKKFFGADAEGAYALVHEGLKKVISLDQLKEQIAGIAGTGTKLVKIETATVKQTPAGAGQGFTMKVFYNLETEKGEKGTFSVKFEQAGFKLHILGYKLNDQP